MVREPGKEAIYEFVDRFRDICLIKGGSIFWPEATQAWSIENLQSFANAFIERPDLGQGDFWSKFAGQLGDQSEDVCRVAAETQAFYSLIVRGNLKSQTKLDHVKQVVSLGHLLDPEGPAWDAFEKAAQTGIASVGTHYSTGKPFVLGFYLSLFIRIRGNSIDTRDSKHLMEVADQVVEALKNNPNVKTNLRQARNVALHLLCPDKFEGSTATGQRKKIIAALGERSGVIHQDSEDDALAKIRAYLEHQNGKRISFYESSIRELWDNPGVAEPVAPVVVPLPQLAKPSNKSNADRLFMEDGFLDELVDLIVERKQVVFEGPPGSGKTFVAEKIAHWLAGDADRVRVVQFHQSYGYEDFVQGIRPRTTQDGGLAYEVRNGIFKHLCEQAASDPDNTYVMLIDEINRGNISRIFGELLYLLEYRDKQVTLTHGGTFSIPANLIVLGTMNSADRSLAQLDYALRRRFAFVCFMPVVNGKASVLQGWLEANVASAPARQRVLEHFIDLNTRISDLLTSDVQVGHSYYMREGIDDPAVQDRVWRFGVRPLLEEYFHHHRDRDTLLAQFAPVLEAESDAFPIDEDALVGPDTEA